MSLMDERRILPDDRDRLRTDAIRGWLTGNHRSPGIARDLAARATAGSHRVGVYDADRASVGSARVVTGHATFAHPADAYVPEDHQGSGIASAMVRYLDRPPRLRRSTPDAHGPYARHGRERISGPSMRRHDPDASRETME